MRRPIGGSLIVLDHPAGEGDRALGIACRRVTEGGYGAIELLDAKGDRVATVRAVWRLSPPEE